jgi:hypothetical protein
VIAMRRMVLAAVVALVAAVPAAARAQAGHAGHGAQTQQASHGAGHAMSGWKELDTFHMMMMTTWHPAKDSADMKPMRQHADSMLVLAKALLASKGPARCEVAMVRDAIVKVEKGTAGLVAMVRRNAADTELKAALAAVHEDFEHTEHGCPAGG